MIEPFSRARATTVGSPSCAAVQTVVRVRARSESNHDHRVDHRCLDRSQMMGCSCFLAVVGATVLANRAGEIINEITLAIKAGLTMEVGSAMGMYIYIRVPRRWSMSMSAMSMDEIISFDLWLWESVRVPTSGRVAHDSSLAASASAAARSLHACCCRSALVCRIWGEASMRTRPQERPSWAAVCNGSTPDGRLCHRVTGHKLISVLTMGFLQ